MIRTLIALAAFGATSMAHADICDRPRSPDLNFEGSEIRRADILSARDAVIEYQNALGAYRECLSRNRSSLTGFQADRLHDASVELEKDAVAQVKAMVVAFKRQSRATR